MSGWWRIGILAGLALIAGAAVQGGHSAPLGLPPAGAAGTDAVVDLGRRLFFDPRLSRDGRVACATCHAPEQGFTRHETATPTGIRGRPLRRNAPTLYNVGYRAALFRDGREASLETQIWGPLLDPDEMGNASVAAVLERVGAPGGYGSAFAAAFPGGLDAGALGRALAAYQRSLVSADSPFDRWFYGGEIHALAADAKRGFERFVAVGCATCHTFSHRFAHFTDDLYHDTGVGYRADGGASDLGRYEVTGRDADRHAFRTPGLRNVALTAPYMHDGSIATLADVVAYYDAGGVRHAGLDPRIRPLGLSARARMQLVRFLESLTGSNAAALSARP